LNRIQDEFLLIAKAKRGSKLTKNEGLGLLKGLHFAKNYKVKQRKSIAKAALENGRMKKLTLS